MNDLELIKKKIKNHAETSVYNPKIKIKKTFFGKIKNWFFNLFKK
jgi:hypothetical protein